MKHIIRASALLLSLCMVLCCIAGCGADDDKKSLTIRTMTILGDSDKSSVYSGLLKEFSADKGWLYIRDTSAKEADAFKLGATLASTYVSSDAPHIVYYYSSTGIEQLEGCFVSIDEIRKYYPDYAKNVSEEAIKCLSTKDVCYGVPVMGEWSGLLINDELFERFALPYPESWEQLIEAVKKLSDSDVYPIANSSDESAIILEALVRGYGGEEAVSQGLYRDETALAGAWTRAFEAYSDLCSRKAFPPAAATDEIAQYASPSELPAINGERQSSAAELFNRGRAAMLLADSAQLANIDIKDKCSLLLMPLPGDAPNKGVLGGYSEGVYITAKAFSNLDIRDTVVELAEYLVSESAAQGFCKLGYMPACSDVKSESAVLGDMLRLFADAQSFSLSQRTVANDSRWSELERLCTELYYGVITPAQAATLYANTGMTLEELLAPTVSESDAPVSSSDAPPNAA